MLVVCVCERESIKKVGRWRYINITVIYPKNKNKKTLLFGRWRYINITIIYHNEIKFLALVFMRYEGWHADADGYYIYW